MRGVAVDPQGNWVALGHGIGQLTVVDLRTGHFLASKKVADVDISLVYLYFISDWHYMFSTVICVTDGGYQQRGCNNFSTRTTIASLENASVYIFT